MIHDTACEGVYYPLQHVTVIAGTIQTNTPSASNKQGDVRREGRMMVPYDMTAFFLRGGVVSHDYVDDM